MSSSEFLTLQLLVHRRRCSSRECCSQTAPRVLRTRELFNDHRHHRFMRYLDDPIGTTMVLVQAIARIHAVVNDQATIEITIRITGVLAEGQVDRMESARRRLPIKLLKVTGSETPSPRYSCIPSRRLVNRLAD